MCNTAVRIIPAVFFNIPDRFKTQETCTKAVVEDSLNLRHFLDHFNTQEMCIKAVEEDPGQLRCVPDQYKTQEMREKNH